MHSVKMQAFTLTLVFMISGAHTCQEFLCRSTHTCIPSYQRCDGQINCPNGEDEFSCRKNCTAEQFACDHMCIDPQLVCDGHYDCADKTDELNCRAIHKDHHKCPEGEFTCGEGTCIPQEFVCDGTVDCWEGEDESHCFGAKTPSSSAETAASATPKELDHECPYPNYRCKDEERTCIAQRHVCDDEPDCLDGSDEINCGNKTLHHQCLASQGMFACGKDTDYDVEVRCIPAAEICNGKPQCPKGEDEADELCSNKKCESAGCEQLCMESSEGAVCYCNEGYTLSTDGKNCKDIDECQIFGTCSQECSNIKGGFECSCMEGYTLVNNRSCEFAGQALLFITMESRNEGQIRSYDLHSTEYHQVVTGIRKPVGVGMDLINAKLYWTDASLGRSVVEQAEFSKLGHVHSQQVFLETGLEHPEDLTVDESSGLVFFSDSGRNHIAACSVSTSACTVISEEHDQPRGLAVHSEDRLLFVTEWGSVPRIVRMNLDGTGRRVLISQDIVWPNGIAVDEPVDRIYWTDAHRDTIESSTIDGTDRKLIVKDATHPFGIAVFEDKVYWSDWHNYRLFSCNKFTGNDIRLLIEAPQRLNGISLHHSLPQIHSNPCSRSQCSHICIPSVHSYSCKCPDDMHLDFDDSTCVATKGGRSLILAAGNQLYNLKPQNLGKITLDPVAFETNAVTGMSTNAFNGDVAVHTNTSQVFYVNTNLKSSTLISIESEIKSLAYDSQSLNLFWIDEVEKTILMMSEQSKRIKTLAKCEDPRAIAHVGSKNIIAIIDGTNLLETSLDGQRTRLLTDKVHPDMRVLTYCEFSMTYYMSNNNGIYAFSPSVGYLEEVVLDIEAPVSLTILDGYLYWTEHGSDYLSWTNIKRHEVDRTVYKLQFDNPDHHEAFLSSKTSENWEKPCLFKGCTDICIRSGEDTARCLCGDGRVLIRDDQFNICQADDSIKMETKDELEGSSQTMTSFVGIIVSLSLILVCLGTVIVVLCCIKQRRHSKAAEYINRSFGLLPSPKKSENPVQMSTVEILRNAGRNEVENPGFCSVDLGYIQPVSSLPVSTLPSLATEKEPGMIPQLFNKMRNFRAPKMSAMDWSESSVAYENLVAAKGSSTPSLRRMQTIEERDSAYTDLSASMDYEECGTSYQSDKSLLIN